MVFEWDKIDRRRVCQVDEYLFWRFEMIKALIIFVWVLCGILSYIILKHSYKGSGLKWYCSDRRVALLISSFGPISLVSSLLVWFVILWNQKEDKPAKW